MTAEATAWFGPVDDGADHDTPQDPATIPVRPLPAPQNPAAPKLPQAMGIYSGPFGRVQANRLLWRAGVGPRPGEAAALAQMGLQNAVYSLTRPGAQTFTGPAATDNDGNPLAPATSGATTSSGGSTAWCTDQPLIERMALVLHDWFATSNEKVNQAQLMIDQIKPFPQDGWQNWSRTFSKTVTQDPAMIVWLDADQEPEGTRLTRTTPAR